MSMTVEDKIKRFQDSIKFAKSQIQELKASQPKKTVIKSQFSADNYKNVIGKTIVIRGRQLTLQSRANYLVSDHKRGEAKQVKQLSNTWLLMNPDVENIRKSKNLEWKNIIPDKVHRVNDWLNHGCGIYKSDVQKIAKALDVFEIDVAVEVPRQLIIDLI